MSYLSQFYGGLTEDESALTEVMKKRPQDILLTLDASGATAAKRRIKALGLTFKERREGGEVQLDVDYTGNPAAGKKLRALADTRGWVHEDSPLEAPTSGFNRHAKLMSPRTRELVLKSRATEIEAFAEDRGYRPDIIAGIAEASMRLGRVPPLTQYGFAGEDAKAIRHFVAGEILNLAIESRGPGPGIQLTEMPQQGEDWLAYQMGLGPAPPPPKVSWETHGPDYEKVNKALAKEHAKKVAAHAYGGPPKASAKAAKKAPSKTLGFKVKGAWHAKVDKLPSPLPRVINALQMSGKRSASREGKKWKIAYAEVAPMLRAFLKTGAGKRGVTVEKQADRIVITTPVGVIHVKGTRTVNIFPKKKFLAEDALCGLGPCLTEVSPPGWSGTVKAMKKHPEIEEPYSLAWSMHKKGAKPHKKPEKGKPKYKPPQEDTMSDNDETLDEGRKDFPAIYAAAFLRLLKKKGRAAMAAIGGGADRVIVFQARGTGLLSKPRKDFRGKQLAEKYKKGDLILGGDGVRTSPSIITMATLHKRVASEYGMRRRKKSLGPEAAAALTKRLKKGTEFSEPVVGDPDKGGTFFDPVAHRSARFLANRFPAGLLKSHNVKVTESTVTDQDHLDEATMSGGMGPNPLMLGTGFMRRPGTLMAYNQWEETAEEQDALNLTPHVGVEANHREAYTLDQLLAMGEGEDEVEEDLEAGEKKPLAKKLRKKSPAYARPGEFDHASGGTAPGKKEKIKVEDEEPGYIGASILTEKKTRAQRKKENKARFAKLSPEQKAATAGDAPFHPEAGKSEDAPVGASILREKKELHPSMHKHTGSEKFRAHVGDPEDQKKPFHKGKGIQEK